MRPALDARLHPTRPKSYDVAAGRNFPECSLSGLCGARNLGKPNGSDVDADCPLTARGRCRRGL